MLQRLAIVIRDDAFDRLFTPLTFAYLAAKQGVQVDILFVLWAVRVLTPEGARALTIDSRHSADEAWFKEKLRQQGDPATIGEFISSLKTAGNVRLYGCQIAAATFGVTPQNLVPEADGIIDALSFVKEKAMTADHCQYF